MDEHVPSVTSLWDLPILSEGATKASMPPSRGVQLGALSRVNIGGQVLG